MLASLGMPDTERLTRVLDCRGCGTSLLAEGTRAGPAAHSTSAVHCMCCGKRLPLPSRLVVRSISVRG
jgi:hypothetical protein